MELIPDQRRIRSYLEGESDVTREVDRWIRREIEICYPDLRQEMDDLCQVIHGKLLESLRAGRFQHRSALKTYVGRITHHAAIDHLRRAIRERSTSGEWALDELSTGQSPYRSLARLEERVLVDQLLLRSPASCRELWRMVFLERLSYPEIARKLGIPAGTVKSRMWHCRRKALALMEELRREGTR